MDLLSYKSFGLQSILEGSQGPGGEVDAEAMEPGVLLTGLLNMAGLASFLTAPICPGAAQPTENWALLH